VAESFTDTPLLTERFDRALHLATAHHARQLRKGTPVPYSAHLLAVASLALEMHGDEDEAIGALLHDVVEDGGGRAALARIEAEFGPAVAAIVLANSDSVDGEDEGGRAEVGRAWYRRKRAYLDGFPDKTPAALRVALADKLHNARSILSDLRDHGPAMWEKFNAPVTDQRWYYNELVRVRSAAHDGPTVRELRRVVDELTREIDES